MTHAFKLYRMLSHRAKSAVAMYGSPGFFDGPRLPDMSMFSFYPTFFNEDEQRILLSSCLKKLDTTESRRAKRRRLRTTIPSSYQPFGFSNGISDLFRPDDMYEFQNNHFDGVITGFREMHVNSWPSEDSAAVNSLLGHLNQLIPDVKTQTHILHLSTEGQIFPHVDNINSSGRWILGVSLGSSRILRLEKSDDERKRIDVLLPSGSVYIQRDSLRYDYKHSILKNELFREEAPTGGQRVSIMIRDVKQEI